MPITQARMISLIGAAQDYQQALARLAERIEQYGLDTERGTISHRQALEILRLESQPHLVLSFPLESPVIIGTEAKHFKLNGRRNARKAANLRENREHEKLGLPKPDRGDGRQDKYHQTKTKQILPDAVPDLGATAPEYLPGSWAEKTAVQRAQFGGKTDILPEDELEFEPGQPDAEGRKAAERFIAEQEAKQAYEQLGEAPINKG